MSEKNVQKWLERIRLTNQAGKFDVPKGIDELPCGCKRFNFPDVSERSNLSLEIRAIIMQFRSEIPNKLFYAYRASLETKLKCGSCSEEF